VNPPCLSKAADVVGDGGKARFQRFGRAGIAQPEPALAVERFPGDDEGPVVVEQPLAEFLRGDGEIVADESRVPALGRTYERLFSRRTHSSTIAAFFRTSGRFLSRIRSLWEKALKASISSIIPQLIVV